MPKFFVKHNQIENNNINIIGEDVNHIKSVLRLKIDDEIQICDLNKSKNYICGITQINKEKVKVKILKKIEAYSESKIHVNIFQGLPKADKMELIIQKSIELGAKEIIPVEMERSIIKLDDNSKNKKIERWQKIAEVAAKQCGRDIIPKINNIISTNNICNLIQNYDIVLLAYENEKKNLLRNEIEKLKNINKDLKIGIIIGPEGGLEVSEVEQLQKNGARVISLGKRILRTETVALALISILMYELGDIGGTY